jgi:DNA-binding CsgD family transcriptional regulator
MGKKRENNFLGEKMFVNFSPGKILKCNFPHNNIFKRKASDGLPIRVYTKSCNETKAPENDIPKIRQNHVNLTKREEEVLVLIVNEHQTKEIAKILFISPRTVESHRKSLFKKTGAKTIVGLVIFAFENNFI